MIQDTLWKKNETSYPEAPKLHPKHNSNKQSQNVALFLIAASIVLACKKMACCALFPVYITTGEINNLN